MGNRKPRAALRIWAGLLALLVSLVAVGATSCGHPPATPAVQTYSDGTYLVGTGMPAGLYKGTPQRAAGVWSISTDAEGMDEVASAQPIGQFYVEVKDGQYLELLDVTIAAAGTSSSTGPLPTYLGTGTFRVGVDAAPGHYRGVVGGTSGDWWISTDANGQNVIAKGSPTADFSVDVQNGQFVTLEYVTLTQ